MGWWLKYPIYVFVVSSDVSTLRCLERAGVEFDVVVSPSLRRHVDPLVSDDRVLELDFSEDWLIHARNWVAVSAYDSESLRHWQLTADITRFCKMERGKRVTCAPGEALSCAEEFADRYTNVALCGLNYTSFAFSGGRVPPFHLNARVATCSLVRSDLSNEYRVPYNEESDMSLQVLSDGLCTVLLNAYTVSVSRSEEDHANRLRGARGLARRWPGVVDVVRKYDRPQPVVFDGWRRFDTPLERVS